METIENAREYIIDKEIDTVLRKSHSEQFEYLEKLIGIKLRENLPIWQTFIEITERRNLLVHCDGVVSNQYIKNCTEHKCKIDKIKFGERLGMKLEYFSNAYKCLYEIATKLTHTIWRKLLISDLEEADGNLNDVCFDLVNADSFELADILLEFGSNQKRHFNDTLRNVLIINGSLSKYLQGHKEEAIKILDKKDWSASSDNFKLAYAILSDDIEKAYEIMIKIGDKGEVDKSDYKQWPLFNKIRSKEKFKETYKAIFQEDYSIMETPMRPVQELINKEIKRDKILKEKTIKKVESMKELKEKEDAMHNKSIKPNKDLPKIKVRRKIKVIDR